MATRDPMDHPRRPEGEHREAEPRSTTQVPPDDDVALRRPSASDVDDLDEGDRMSRRHADDDTADRMSRSGGFADADVDRPSPAPDSDVDDDIEKRWELIQSRFLDSPREAAAAADELVADRIASITRRLDTQRAEVADIWRHDEADTEDVRTAMLRYREVLDRIAAAPGA